MPILHLLNEAELSISELVRKHHLFSLYSLLPWLIVGWSEIFLLQNLFCLQLKKIKQTFDNTTFLHPPPPSPRPLLQETANNLQVPIAVSVKIAIWLQTSGQLLLDFNIFVLLLPCLLSLRPQCLTKATSLTTPSQGCLLKCAALLLMATISISEYLKIHPSLNIVNLCVFNYYRRRIKEDQNIDIHWVCIICFCSFSLMHSFVYYAYTFVENLLLFSRRNVAAVSIWIRMEFPLFIFPCSVQTVSMRMELSELFIVCLHTRLHLSSSNMPPGGGEHSLPKI